VFKLVETKFERNKGVAGEIFFIRVLNNLVVSCVHMNEKMVYASSLVSGTDVKKKYIQVVLKKEDKSITALFIRGF
jgi:hypothetical protein